MRYLLLIMFVGQPIQSEHFKSKEYCEAKAYLVNYIYVAQQTSTGNPIDANRVITCYDLKEVL